MSLFLVACLRLSVTQMTKRKPCKLPTKEGKRFDHAMKLEASLKFPDIFDEIVVEVEVSQR